jgi:hypothetical protein
MPARRLRRAYGCSCVRGHSTAPQPFVRAVRCRLAPEPACDTCSLPSLLPAAPGESRGKAAWKRCESAHQPLGTPQFFISAISFSSQRRDENEIKQRDENASFRTRSIVMARDATFAMVFVRTAWPSSSPTRPTGTLDQSYGVGAARRVSALDVRRIDDPGVFDDIRLQKRGRSQRAHTGNTLCGSHLWNYTVYFTQMKRPETVNANCRARRT